MGIMDFFRRNKNKGQMQQVQSNGAVPPAPGLNLSYRSGTQCQVQFTRMFEIPVGPNGQTKLVQEATITYIESNDKFSVKTVYMDPMQMPTPDGEMVYATELYYKTWAQQNQALVKGFFQKDQLSVIENNYIGYIGVDPTTGAYNRSYDHDLKNHYDEDLRQKKAMQKYTDEQRFEQSLKDQTKKIEEIQTNIKTSHAKELTKEDYEQVFGDR